MRNEINKKVFTTGTFDVLHIGHINLLRRAKEFGDYLIVGVNLTKNGHNTYYSIKDRVEMLKSIKYVDEVVVLESQQDKFRYIKECDIFAIGSDYKGFEDISEIEKYTEVKFIERTPDVSSTQVKEFLGVNITREFNTFVIDIDDTIVTVENRDFINGKPHKSVIDKINKLYDQGWNIILFTSRGQKSCDTTEEMVKKYFDITTEWLNKNNVKYSKLLFGKPNADYYVDNKNISISEFLNL